MSAKRRRLIYVLISLIILFLAALSCQPPPDVEIAPPADSLSTEGNSPTALSTPELTHSPTGETPPFSETPTVSASPTLTATATITPTVTGTATVLQWPSPTRLVTLTP